MDAPTRSAPDVTVRKRLPSWLLFAVLAACVLVLLFGCIFLLPSYFVDRDLGSISATRLSAGARLKAINDVRATLLQGLGGAFFLATAFFTWRQVRISQQQLQLSEDQQIADRFARAVEQLGKTGPDVRLGGIFALEQIAYASSAYCDVIAEILAAYVRQNAPLRSTPAATSRPLSPAVQAALTVLGRTVARRRVRSIPIDLCNVDLSGADLRDAVMPGVYMNGSKLTKAHFERAQLAGARFVRADLTGARLDGTNLSGQARLIETVLIQAKLFGTDLTDANLTDAVVDTKTRMVGTKLGGARLRRVALEKTRYGQLTWNEETEWPKGFVLRDETGDASRSLPPVDETV
jgi:hypothetical protein